MPQLMIGQIFGEDPLHRKMSAPAFRGVGTDLEKGRRPYSIREEGREKIKENNKNASKIGGKTRDYKQKVQEYRTKTRNREKKYTWQVPAWENGEK